MTGKPTDSLAHQLARRGDFRQLWQLAREMPLERAVGLMPLFADWRPDDDAGRALFGRLAATRPQAVAAATDELRAAAATGVRVKGRDAVLGDVAFAPDLSQVAVLGSYFSRRGYLRGNGPEYRKTINVFALPGGRRVDRLATARDTRRILHLGNSILEVTGDVLPTRVTLRTGRRHKLLWGTPDEDRRSGYHPNHNGYAIASAPGHTRDGFAVAGTGVPGGQLILGAADGTRLRLEEMSQFGMSPARFEAYSLATDPGSGRIALGGFGDGDSLVILDDRLQVVARAPVGELDWRKWAEWITFAGSDRLVTAGRDGLRLWRRAGGDLVVAASVPTPDSRSLAVLPATGQIAHSSSSGSPTYYDAETLTVTEAPPGLSGIPWTSLWSTPGGEYAAVRGAEIGGVRILDLRLSAVTGLVPKSVGSMRPVDLTAVTTAARGAATPAVRDLLDLLRACLEYRWTTQPASGEP